MPLKSWFGGGGKGRRGPQPEIDSDQPTIEDLIVLERYDEAAERLQARLKDEPKDLHAHLRLAEVHMYRGEGSKALDEYSYVADEYARDGFYDKGLALLRKASKLAPGNDELRIKVAAFRQAKALEHKRDAALEGLKHRPADASRFSAVELQGLWRGLLRSPIIDRLDSAQVERVFSCIGVERREAGEIVAREGDPGEALLIVAKGSVEAVTGPQQTSILTLGTGDVLGDEVLFRRRPWPATYRVGADGAIVFTLGRQGLETCLQGNSDPRGLLEALRFQAKDVAVETAAGKIRARR